jgi:hypothetical protein
MERISRTDSINLETGEFPMVLATEGEASDGHILSIRGGSFPDSLPLQLSHANDPQATLGSIRGFEKQLKENPARVTAMGQIELTGPSAEARRDLAHMISKGHVNRVSIRWDGTKATPRRALPREHPAYVAEDEPSFIKRSGVFFEEWRALEGSVVAVPADSEAVIGRMIETGDPMWERLAQDCISITDLVRSHEITRNLLKEIREQQEEFEQRLNELLLTDPAPAEPSGESEERASEDIAAVFAEELGGFREEMAEKVQGIFMHALGRVK